MPSLSAPSWLRWRLPWGHRALRVVVLLGVGGMAGGAASAGLIGYLEQTNDHRFEPWAGDDPSYSEDPLNVMGPPLSPLALFPWMWQRHHPGDLVSLHTVELLEAEVVRPGPPPVTTTQGKKSLRLAGPWGTRRKIPETYRALFDTKTESAERAGQTPPRSGPRQSKSLDDDDD